MTGSGGSGILIARKADGTWSPPSALLLHTPTLSFIMGVDVYDCVLVVNNLSALESIVQPQVTLGEDVGLSAGPMLPHGSTEEDIRWRDLGNNVLTYLKAKGQVQHANLNGCILTERSNENERFYGNNATMMDILAGNVFKNVEETRPLFEVIKQAEGRSDFDSSIIDQISTQCAPGDALIESPKPTPPVSPSRPSSAFGVPDSEDPDPFGVLALEMAGLEIREAGSRLRPTSSQFDYAPSPTSPLFPRFKRTSGDTFGTRSNRGSCLSVQTHVTTDAGTQTSTSNTPHTTPSLSQSEDGRDRHSLEKARGLEDVAEEEVDYTKIDFSPIQHHLNNASLDGMTMAESPATTDEDRHTERDASSDEMKHSSANTSPETTPVLKPEDVGDDADDEDDEDDEPVVVYEVASAVRPVQTAAAVRPQVMKARGAIVNIPKRIPPPLPLRNPARGSRTSRSSLGDMSELGTPVRSSFGSEQRASARDSVNSEVLSGAEAKTPVVAERRADDQVPEVPVEFIDRKDSTEAPVAATNEEPAQEQETTHDDAVAPDADDDDKKAAHESSLVLSNEGGAQEQETARDDAVTSEGDANEKKATPEESPVAPSDEAPSKQKIPEPEVTVDQKDEPEFIAARATSEGIAV